jgi:hypothetical protein
MLRGTWQEATPVVAFAEVLPPVQPGGQASEVTGFPLLFQRRNFTFAFVQSTEMGVPTVGETSAERMTFVLVAVVETSAGPV